MSLLQYKKITLALKRPTDPTETMSATFAELELFRRTVNMPELLANAGVESEQAPVSEQITLYYYPATGRAEASRLILAEAGTTWTDVWFQAPEAADFYASPAAFGANQGTETFQNFLAAARELGGNLTTNLPLLQVGDRVYGQSVAQQRYLARRFGLMPTDVEEEAVVNEVIQHVCDLFIKPYEAWFGAISKQQLSDEVIPKHVANLERMLQGRDFFTGKFTVADLLVFDAMTHLYERSLPGCLEVYPQLTAMIQRVASRPNIAAYLSSDEYKATLKLHPLA